MKRVLFAAMLLSLAGCGVDWFPAPAGSGSFSNTSTASNASAPTAFTFQTNTVTTASAIADPTSYSDTVTITGNNPDGWTVSAEDTPSTVNSYVFVNGNPTIRDNNGHLLPLTVHPNDTLQIVQNQISQTAGTVTTTVTVGTYTTQFKTVTK